MKRDSAATIFRTVVFAGAMLGAPACGKKPAQQTTPTNTTTQPAGGDAKMEGDAKPAGGDQTKADPCAAPADPCAAPADPCARPRGTDEDGGGGMGRGFILS